MKLRWHDHPMGWKAWAQVFNMKGPAQEIGEKLVRNYIALAGQHSATVRTAVALTGEIEWTHNSRPYYDVFPSVAGALMKVDLGKIKCSQVKLPLPQLLIRCPVGKELQLSPDTKMRTALVTENPGKKEGSNKVHMGWCVTMFDDQPEFEIVRHPVRGYQGRVPICSINTIVMDETTIEERLIASRSKDSLADPIDNQAMDNLYRLIVSLCLLGENTDLISPQPLDADLDRWYKTHDLALIERAVSKGKRGWSIGEHFEVQPGFVDPYFAIRWMGKGELKQPVVRPISGYLKKREQVTEVPTGYLDELEQRITRQEN